jgi:hypothetical protein
MNIPPHLSGIRSKTFPAPTAGRTKRLSKNRICSRKQTKIKKLSLHRGKKRNPIRCMWLQRQTALFSYSGLKKLGVEIMPEEKGRTGGEPSARRARRGATAGHAHGLAVHALCEIVDIAERGRAVHADAGSTRRTRGNDLPGVDPFGLPATLWRRVGENVHAAYCTPVVTDEISLPALCNSSALIREAEFRISWDERLRACLSAFFPHVPRASGSLMAILMRLPNWMENCGWWTEKPTCCPITARKACVPTCNAHYVLQAVIYEDALLRMRPHLPYGGFLYVFVRVWKTEEL